MIERYWVRVPAGAAEDDDDKALLNVLMMSADILGTSCDQCRSTVQ